MFVICRNSKRIIFHLFDASRKTFASKSKLGVNWSPFFFFFFLSKERWNVNFNETKFKINGCKHLFYVVLVQLNLPLLQRNKILSYDIIKVIKY